MQASERKPSEPIFRCFQDDLDHDDPRRDGPSFSCVDCRHMVWCEAPGEYMTAWFDTRIGPLCMDCFYCRYKATGFDTHLWDELDEWVTDEWRENNKRLLAELRAKKANRASQ